MNCPDDTLESLPVLTAAGSLPYSGHVYIKFFNPELLIRNELIWNESFVDCVDMEILIPNQGLHGPHVYSPSLIVL